MGTQEKFEAQFPAETRYDTITQLITQVKEGNFCQVVGVPGTGRSHLVGLLAYNKKLRVRHLGDTDEQFFHFVPLNFSEIRGKDTADALRFLMFGLLDSLHERGLTEEHEYVEKLFSQEDSDELQILRTLKKAVDYLAFEKKIKLILLFDHFEEFIPSVQDTFFAHLAALQLRARYYFSVVFFLHRPLEQLVPKDILPDVFKLFAGRTIFLPIKDDPLVRFLFSYTERVLGKSISKILQENIVRVTGGHGKLVKVVAEEVLRLEAPELERLQGDAKALDVFLTGNKVVRGVLYEIWEVLYPEEQAVLRQLVSEQANKAQESRNTEILRYLAQLGIIHDESCTIPLFQTFIAYRVRHQLDEKLYFNDENKRLYKGESDLTERLTAAEFSLLRYFLDHPDTIIDREQIVTVVWSEVKSTAGVTEQAIDQLLYRLRQKIEENPAEPRHLITIKGRGVKFTP